MLEPGEKLLFLSADQLKFVCTHSTHSGGKKVINEPTNESKVLPKAPNAEVWEEALGDALRADVQQSAPRDSELRVSWT